MNILPKQKETHKLVVAKGQERWGRDGLGVWDQQMQSSIYRMDKQQGPTVQHREPYAIISYDKS